MRGGGVRGRGSVRTKYILKSFWLVAHSHHHSDVLEKKSSPIPILYYLITI